MRKENIERFAKMLQPVRFKPTSVIKHVTDGRTPFDSDFSRVALSASVRRLQDKTQVFPLAEYDFVRNRLTHSLEVLTIARGLGLGVEKIFAEREWLDLIHRDDDLRNAISKILEVAALIHDIGNPPFGHNGEKAVQNYFRDMDSFLSTYIYSDELNPNERADLQNIEGNVQGFRILTRLALAKHEFSFNLTLPVLATIVKYPFSSKEGNVDSKTEPFKKKFGFFDSEASKYAEMCDILGLTHGKRHPLTFLLEAADDITYNACDLEDGFKEGAISIKDIQECITSDNVNDDVALINLVNQLCDDDEHQLENEIIMQDLRIAIQSRMIVACTKEFTSNIDAIIEGTYNKPLLENTEYSALCKALGKLDKFNFNSSQVRSKEDDGIYKMLYLLDGYAKAMILLSEDSSPLTPEYLLYMTISPNYRNATCDKGKTVPSTLYNKLLLVTDFIFGMTDGFVLKVYEDPKISELILRVKCKIDNL